MHRVAWLPVRIVNGVAKSVLVEGIVFTDKGAIEGRNSRCLAQIAHVLLRGRIRRPRGQLSRFPYRRVHTIGAACRDFREKRRNRFIALLRKLSFRRGLVSHWREKAWRAHPAAVLALARAFTDETADLTVAAVHWEMSVLTL